MFKTLVRALSIVVVSIMTVATLASPPPAYAQKTPPSQPQVFILIPGLNTELTKDEVKAGTTPDFEAVQAAITQVVPSAQFVTFSYNGFRGKKDPRPAPYACIDTHMNRMSVDIAVLDKQIQAILSKQPDAQIYLVGHSLGGVIAYGYMDALQVGGVVTPLDNSNLRGVVTLDSPLGGVSTDPTYTSYAVTYFETTCPDYSVNQDLALLDLGTIYNNAPGENVPRGGHDSILSVPFAGTVTLPDPLPSNQTLARQAHNNDGTNVLTVGNTLDRLWIPDTCDVPVLQFRHTQWLVDGGDDSGIYGRAITSSVGTCQLDLLLNRGNHFDTLTNPSVLEGIQQFITGQTPSALSSAPGES